MNETLELWKEFVSNWQDWNRSRVSLFIHEFGKSLNEVKTALDAANYNARSYESEINHWAERHDRAIEARDVALAKVDALRRCGLCTSDKPCNFEGCPDDTVQVMEYNAVIAELKEAKSKNYKDQLDNCSRQCANLKKELETLKSGLKPEWIVNELAELGVKVGNRKFFLYKGRSLENSGTKYRLVGKREFGECCHPWHMIQRLSGEERLPEDYSQFYKEEGEEKLWKQMKE